MSVISGSSAARRAACPGSYALEQSLPSIESEHAALGTVLHEAIAEYCINLLPDGKSVKTLKGRRFKGVEITQSLVRDKLQPAAEALQELIEQAEGFKSYYAEEKVRYLDGNNYIDFYGYGNDGKTYIVDFKFGDGVPVDVKYNYQMLYYFCALYVKPPDENVVLGIIQPKTGMSDVSCLDTWELPGAQWSSWDSYFRTIYDACLSKTPEFKVGSHCRFCKANAPGVCPKKTEIAEQATAMLKPEYALTPDRMSHYLALAEQIEPAIKTLRAHAHKQLETGVNIPGYKIVAKRAQRVYSSPAEAGEVLESVLPLHECYHPAKLLSPAQAEKALGKAKYREVLADHVSSVSSGTTMVREDDSRPAILSPRQILSSKAADLPKSMDFKDLERKRG